MSSVESPRLNTKAFPKVREIIKPDGTKRTIKIHKDLVPEQTEEEDQREANISILKPQDITSLFEMAKSSKAIVFEAPKNGAEKEIRELVPA